MSITLVPRQNRQHSRSQHIAFFWRVRARVMQRAIRNESIEQAAPFQKIDEERQLPERRQRRLGIPFDMHRPGETVEAHALQRAFVFNRRLLTRKVNGGTRKIGHYANDNARFSSNPNQPTAVSRMKTEGKTPEWCPPRSLASLLKILITQDGIGGCDHRTCLQRYFRGRGWPPARTDCSRRTR